MRSGSPTGNITGNGGLPAPPPSSGPGSGSSQNTPSQSTKQTPPSNTSNSPGVGNSSGPSSTARSEQTSHGDTDPSAAVSQPDISQTAPAPAITPAAFTAAVAWGGTPVVAESLAAKPNPAPTSAAEAGAAASAAEAPPAAAPGPVQMAEMINRVGQSEMRIGLNTPAFGSVEVRTVVHASDVGLLIGSEKGDLRSLLANEIPVLANALQQQNLRLNSVNFHQGFAFSNHTSGGGDPQQRPFAPPRGLARFRAPEMNSESSVEMATAMTVSAGIGLSILA